MITNEEWARIRGYTDQVVNREGNEIVFHGGHVRRETSGNIYITLRAMELNLEPDPEDIPDELPCGPGWPD